MIAALTHLGGVPVHWVRTPKEAHLDQESPTDPGEHQEHEARIGPGGVTAFSGGLGGLITALTHPAFKEHPTLGTIVGIVSTALMAGSVLYRPTRRFVHAIRSYIDPKDGMSAKQLAQLRLLQNHVAAQTKQVESTSDTMHKMRLEQAAMRLEQTALSRKIEDAVVNQDVVMAIESRVQLIAESVAATAEVAKALKESFSDVSSQFTGFRRSMSGEMNSFREEIRSEVKAIKEETLSRIRRLEEKAGIIE